MSDLSKKIQRARRREGSAGMGFGAARREQPRAMVLAVAAGTAAAAKAALEAGADVVIVEGLDAPAAAKLIKGLGKATVGARLAAFDLAGAATLKEAGCDFVIAPLETTSAMAVDTDAMGHVVEAHADLTEAMLRSLGPLGLDALAVSHEPGAMTLAQQLDLVRYASFASTPLVVPVTAEAKAAELRVLRDSGVAVVTAPAGITAKQLGTLSDELKAVPASGKAKRDGGEVAIVPSLASHAGDHEHDDDDDDGE